MSHWTVKSVHFNVQAGDAALHHLYKDNVRVSTVWIDGSDGAEVSLESLRAYFNKQTGMVIDAVVVTHWDSDHYMGIYRMLEADFVASQMNASWKPSFFKYNGNEPQTRFYSPYWKNIPKPSGKSSGDPPKPAFDKFDGEKDVGYLGIKIKGVVYGKIAKLHYDNLLGVDFFNPIDDTPYKLHTTSFANPQALITFHQNQSWHKIGGQGYQAPGLYCVAQNWVTMPGPKSQPNLPELEASASSPMETIEVPDDLTLTNVFSTQTNQTSIAAMLIWDSGQISLYTAGDRDDRNEAPIVTWSQTTGEPEVGKCVTTVKAGHHGACTSSPGTLFSKFNPENVIISCGGDYGHPRWEVIFFTSLWNKYNKTKLEEEPYAAEYRNFEKPLLSTNFPYWLAKDANGSWIVFPRNKISSAVYDNAYTKFDGFAEEMSAIVKQINYLESGILYGKRTHTQSTMTEYEVLLMKAPDRAEKLRWISGKASAAWTELSPVGTESYPVMSAKGYYYGSALQVGDIRRDRSIDYITVEHCTPQYREGSLAIVYKSGIEIEVRDNSKRPDPKITKEQIEKKPKARPQDESDVFLLPVPYSQGSIPQPGAIIFPGKDGDIYNNPNIDPDEEGNIDDDEIPTEHPSPPKYPSVTWPKGTYFYDSSSPMSPWI